MDYTDNGGKLLVIAGPIEGAELNNLNSVLNHYGVSVTEGIVVESDRSYGILSAASYDDLRHQEIFWADFGDMTRIDITLEGNSHTLISEPKDEESPLWYYQDALSATAATDDTTGATGKTQEVLDLTDFEAALSVLYSSSFTDEMPTGKEEIRLLLHLDKENFPETEIILYRYDGSHCLAVIDGDSVALVPRSSVMELVEAIRAIVLN